MNGVVQCSNDINEPYDLLELLDDLWYDPSFEEKDPQKIRVLSNVCLSNYVKVPKGTLAFLLGFSHNFLYEDYDLNTFARKSIKVKFPYLLINDRLCSCIFVGEDKCYDNTFRTIALFEDSK